MYERKRHDQNTQLKRKRKIPLQNSRLRPRNDPHEDGSSLQGLLFLKTQSKRFGPHFGLRSFITGWLSLLFLQRQRMGKKV